MDTSPRSELLADVIEVDRIYRRHGRWLTVALLVSLLANVLFACATVGLILRNHVFVFPAAVEDLGTPMQPRALQKTFSAAREAAEVVIGVSANLGARSSGKFPARRAISTSHARSNDSASSKPDAGEHVGRAAAATLQHCFLYHPMNERAAVLRVRMPREETSGRVMAVSTRRDSNAE